MADLTVHDPPIEVFTMVRSRCSRWSETRTEHPQVVEDLKAMTADLCSPNRTIRAAADSALQNQGIDLGVGMTAALETDPSGGRSRDFLHKVAKASDYQVAERLRAESLPNLTDPEDDGTRDAMHHLRMGMRKLLLKHRAASDLLAGKTRGYLKKAIEDNAFEDATRNLIFRDHDGLEMTAKGVAKRKKVELDGQQERQQHSTLNHGLCRHDAPIGEQLEALLAREREAEREAVVSRFRDTLTPELVALFDLIRQGEREADARRQLGLPQSQGNALRNHMTRFREKLKRESA